VLEQQGRDAYEHYIRSVKQTVLGIDSTQTTEADNKKKAKGHQKITYYLPAWSEISHKVQTIVDENQVHQRKTELYKLMRKARKLTKEISHALTQARQIEWCSAKNHYIRTGRYGNIANMINPKNRTGPTASRVYPSKPGEPVRYALNDEERMEASLATHQAWMSNPPGSKNCHFIDIEEDETGPTGVSICSNKPFDNIAQWKYLDGLLEQKLDYEIAERVKLAHQRVPRLFEKIKTDTFLTYPFRYHCLTGEYMYPDLEHHIRQNIGRGNGKARATGFAIPVLGRFPKIFADVYIIKCKIQMALRLLDLNTENSLRICIGKPCGGVRPLTVGHDDNVFLNGLAQQAIQKEIAKLKLLPENVFSYQRGKGCADATILDQVVKEIALQRNDCYVAKIDDDAEKMFDRLHMELQAALLIMAGAGMHGFTEWQCANMANRTNKLVTDIFVSLLKYQCGLPQGNGFSVEVANLYAMLLLLWWNMDPINPEGTIAPFHSPRHGYQLIAGGILKPVSSLAYVDDATRFVSMLKRLHTIEEFFEKVQGYCDLLADLSLVIKMGRNVNKCTILLYNVPENATIPEFTSIAWSYDARGPVKGSIKTIVMQRNTDDHLVCYQVPENLRANAPQPIQDILRTHKYLGVPSNAQLDGKEGREKLLRKLQQRIGLITAKSNSITETKIAHNMLVCQVATFSPICISFTLQECMAVDKQLIKAYQYRLKHMPSDAKHNTFISEKRGGMGLRSFTREYVGALMRDIEVYISNANTLPAHALQASIEEATKQCLWVMNQEDILPHIPQLKNAVQQFNISAKRVIRYDQTFDTPEYEQITYNHSHVMGRAIQTTALMGFMLRDLDHELCSRFTDELLITDNKAKTLGSPNIANRAKLGATIGEGNRHLTKYSLTGRIYLIIREIVHLAAQHLSQVNSQP